MNKDICRKETLLIIPARGGSKGIYRKNLQHIGGIPLIAYSILIARKAKNISRVIVSTEDEEIADISKYYGAEVPFLRPKDLAVDNSNIKDAIDHVLMKLKTKEGYIPDIIAEMYPTHPFRKSQLIDHLISKLDAGYQSVITVRSISLQHPIRCILSSDGKVQLLKTRNDELLKMAVRPYAFFYARSTKHSPLGVYLYHLSDSEQFVDIDEPEDLALARNFVRHGYYSLEK